MKVKLLSILLLTLLNSRSTAQCNCAWIMEFRDSAQLIDVYRNGGARGYDEFSTGFFRKRTEGGERIVDSKGNEVLSQAFDKIIRINEDSSFLTLRSGTKQLVKIWKPDSITLELDSISDLWYIANNEYIYLKGTRLLFMEAGIHREIGHVKGDSLYIVDLVIFSKPNTWLFFGLLRLMPTIFVGDLILHGIATNSLIFKEVEKNNFYTANFFTESEVTKLKAIGISDSLKWGRKKYYFGSDGASMFYLPQSYRARVYDLPYNKDFTTYEKLRPRDFNSALFPSPIKQGKNSWIIFPDTILKLKGRLDIIDYFANEELLLVSLDDKLRIFNIDSLVIYDLDGGVLNVAEACPLYILTQDKENKKHIYDLQGREIASSNVNGFLLGNYYFDESSGELVLKVER